MTKPVPASYCVVVADGARARFFTLGGEGGPRSGHAARMVEQAELVNPTHSHSHGPADLPGGDWRRASAGGPGRNDDASDANWRREQDRRFAGQLVEKLSELCQMYHATTAVMVADARMIGLLRQKADRFAGVELHEHTRDLTGFDAWAVHTHLAAAGLLPPMGMASRPVAMR